MEGQIAMKMVTIPPDITISSLLKEWPELISVFIGHGMACVGCSLSRFETISEAAVVYNLPIEAFHQELQAAISDQAGRDNPNSSMERTE